MDHIKVTKSKHILVFEFNQTFTNNALEAVKAEIEDKLEGFSFIFAQSNCAVTVISLED